MGRQVSAHFYLNVENVVEPVVAGMGYELVDLPVSSGGRLLRLLGYDRRTGQQRRDRQHPGELSKYGVHERPPCAAGTGTTMRSGAFSSLAMLSASSIAPAASGSGTNRFCSPSQ